MIVRPKNFLRSKARNSQDYRGAFSPWPRNKGCSVPQCSRSWPSAVGRSETVTSGGYAHASLSAAAVTRSLQRGRW